MACLICEGSPSTHPLLSYCGVWRKEQEAGCGEVKHTAVTAHSCLSPGSAAHSRVVRKVKGPSRGFLLSQATGGRCHSSAWHSCSQVVGLTQPG